MAALHQTTSPLWRWGTLALVLAGMTATLTAQPLNDAELSRLIKAEAGRGSPEMQCNIGFQYALGTASKKGTADMRQAVLWYTKAADKNYGPAQYRLAYCYLKGEGVAASEDKAMRLMRQAAKNGLAEAQYEYAMLLAEYKARPGRKNENDELDKDDPAYYFSLAAINGRGIPMAQWRLAKTYSRLSMPEVLELKWAFIAARNGCPDAIVWLEGYQKFREKPEKERTDWDRNFDKRYIEAEALANEFFNDPARTKTP